MTARTEMSSAAGGAIGNESEITFKVILLNKVSVANFFYWRRGDLTEPLQGDIGQGLG